MLVLHQIVISDEKRLLKKIIEEQIDEDHKCWYSGVKIIMEMYLINDTITNIKEMSKSEWKKIIKERITKVIKGENTKYIETHTKLRFLHGKGEKWMYFHNLKINEIKLIMEVRLNMVKVKSNFKNLYGDNLICDLCKSSEDTTEHLFECEELKEFNSESKKLLCIIKSVNDENEVKYMYEYIEKSMCKRGKLFE